MRKAMCFLMDAGEIIYNLRKNQIHARIIMCDHENIHL